MRGGIEYSFSYSILCGNNAKFLTFFRSFTGLTTSQSFPQERIQGIISSREFRVKESSGYRQLTPGSAGWNASSVRE
jgi:hypothetical protein